MIYLDVDASLSEVPVNAVPLVSSADFTTIDETIAFNESGMELFWHFTTSAGATTVTAVTPTSGGNYDWAHQDGGIYTIEIPASGGASINNDTEGYGYFTGKADGVLPWRSPTYCFRAAAVNDALCDGGDVLDVNATQISGDGTAADTLELFAEALDQATGQLDGGSFNGVLPTNFAALGIEATGEITEVATLTGHTAQTGDSFAYLGTNLGALGANATEAGGTGDHLTALLTSAAFTAALPANFADLAITATDGRVDVGHVAGTELTAPYAGGNFATFFENGDVASTLTVGHLMRMYRATIAAVAVVDDPGEAATATVFPTSLTEVDDFWNDALIVFTSGALAGQVRAIADYANEDGQITLDEPLAAAPADMDSFSVLVSHVHPISQIQQGLATAAELAKVPKKDEALTFTRDGADVNSVSITITDAD